MKTEPITLSVVAYYTVEINVPVDSDGNLDDSIIAEAIDDIKDTAEATMTIYTEYSDIELVNPLDVVVEVL